MIKLIKLEWKKHNTSKYLRHALILAVILGVFIFSHAFLGIAIDPETGVPDAAPGHNNLSSPIELFTSISYLVFTSVMLASFIVSSYKNKTLMLMFTYPISRKKIMVSQMLAVWLFNLFALIVTKVFLYGMVLVGSQFMTSAFPLDFDMTSPLFYFQLIFKAIITVTMGFIALFIGMTFKSSKATIVSSFLLIILTQANIGDLTLANNTIFPIILTILSLFLGYLSIRTVNSRDLA